MQTIATASKPSTSTTTATTNSTMQHKPRTRFNWIFPAEKFQLTPSMNDGLQAEEELSMRQNAAVFIHELGSSLKLPHYCVNTAVVYMHRFFMINSFQKLNQFRVCAACLFLACKVEEMPRQIKDVVEHTSKILKRKKTNELSREMIAQYTEDIILHENMLLSTLGFSLMVDHPHSLIVKTIQGLGSQIQSLPEKTPRELAQTAYYLATKSILLTSFCVKYPPDLIACFCIHLAAAWLKIEMPNPTTPESTAASSTSTTETTDTNNTGGRRWFHLLNNSFTEKQLGELADEFLAIYEKCPEKIKKKLVYQNERPQQNSQDSGSNSSQSGSSRPTDLADSVVPQGSVKNEKTDQHRQIQPPLPSTRPPQQPPLPPPPPPPPAHPHMAQSSSGAVRRDVPPTSASNFSANHRSSAPPHRGGPYQSQQQAHGPNNFQGQHHMNHNYHSDSRYSSQQQRMGSAPSHRTSQPPPPSASGIPSPYNMERKPPQPMPGSHPYEQSGSMGAPGSSSGNRSAHGPPQRNAQHHNVLPTGQNPYQSASGNVNHPPHGHAHIQHHGHSHHPHQPQRMSMGGEKRNYESSYDPNHSKRSRPS